MRSIVKYSSWILLFNFTLTEIFMKKTILFISGLIVAGTVFAQGKIEFENNTSANLIVATGYIHCDKSMLLPTERTQCTIEDGVKNAVATFESNTYGYYFAASRMPSIAGPYVTKSQLLFKKSGEVILEGNNQWQLRD
jgi:hypothetical protein